MANITTEILPVNAGLVPAVGTLGIAATVKLPKGTIVCLDANGRAALPIAPGTAGIPAAGIARATFDNTAGANDALLAEIEYGLFEYPYVGTAPKAQAKLYVVDNHSVSATQSDGTANRGLAGVCTEVDLVRLTCVCWFGPFVSLYT